jgi:hypothetical protein
VTFTFDQAHFAGCELVYALRKSIMSVSGSRQLWTNAESPALLRACEAERKHPRETVHFPVKIDAGGSMLRDGIVLDISDGGARIAIGNPQLLPAIFTAFLSPRGVSVWRCRVVWRGLAEVGVEFDRKPPS